MRKKILKKFKNEPPPPPGGGGGSKNTEQSIKEIANVAKIEKWNNDKCNTEHSSLNLVVVYNQFIEQ